MDLFEYYLYLFGILMFNVLLVIALHAVMVIVWSYLETGMPFFYIRNFYHNMYHLDL